MSGAWLLDDDYHPRTPMIVYHKDEWNKPKKKRKRKGRIKKAALQSSKRNLLKTYGHACFYCRTPITLETMTKDHYIPRSKGGRGAKNYRPSCVPCNRKKGNRMPHEFDPQAQMREV